MVSPSEWKLGVFENSREVYRARSLVIGCCVTEGLNLVELCFICKGEWKNSYFKLEDERMEF